MRYLAVAAAVTVGLFALTSCGDSPKCLESHVSWQFVPVFNGKITTLVWTPVDICDKREGDR